MSKKRCSCLVLLLLRGSLAALFFLQPCTSFRGGRTGSYLCTFTGHRARGGIQTVRSKAAQL